MRLFPYENYSIISNLKPDEVERRLQSTIYIPGIENNGTLNSGYDIYAVKYFKGYAMANKFEIQPDISYRNSFLPQIKGRIEPDNNGSIIHIKMTLMPFAIIFMCIVLVFLAAACLSATINSISTRIIDFKIIAPYGGILFCYCLATLGFKYESKKSKYILLDIFDGKLAN